MGEKFNKLIRLSFVFLIFILVSCSIEPQPIKMGDTCSFCLMGVADNRFGAELITKKGKIYKFDDTHCLLEFLNAQTVPKEQQKSILFVNFETPHGFLDAKNAFLLKSVDLRSPMGSNIAAFESLEKLKESQTKLGGEVVEWASLASN